MDYEMPIFYRCPFCRGYTIIEIVFKLPELLLIVWNPFSICMIRATRSAQLSTYCI